LAKVLKTFKKKLVKYTKQHNLPPLQFSEVDDNDTLSGSQPDNIFNNSCQVMQEILNVDNNMLTEGQREKLKEIIDRSNNDGQGWVQIWKNLPRRIICNPSM
jgi:hypothetical protein